MEPLVLMLRCLLAAVFAVAGVTKLLDVAGSRRALEGFAVPASLVPFGAIALPALELGCAAALLIGPSARYGAIASLVLLIVFVAAILRANAQGRMPDCHCFGQLESEPAGPSTVLRNLLLAAIAVTVIAVGPWLSVSRGFDNLTGPQLGMVGFASTAVLLSLVAAHYWGKSRQTERELLEARAGRQPAGLPRGSVAPEFDLTPLRGESGALRQLLLSGRPVVLVFVSTSCGPCLELLPQLARWQASLAQAVTLVAIFAGQHEEMLRLTEGAGLSLALAQEADEIFERYRLRATPSAVGIELDGTIATAAAEGSPAIEAVVRSMITRQEQPGYATQPA